VSRRHGGCVVVAEGLFPGDRGLDQLQARLDMPDK
jgi:hypothetical protein